MGVDASADAVGFGDLLRRHRVAAGLTQEGLADLAGLSARGISDLERGVKRRPRRDTLEFLIRALDLPAPDRVAFVTAARAPAATISRTAAGTGPAAARRVSVAGADPFPAVGRPWPPTGSSGGSGRWRPSPASCGKTTCAW